MAKELTKRQKMLKEMWTAGSMTCPDCGKLRTIGHTFLLCLDCNTAISLNPLDRKLIRVLFPDRVQDTRASRGTEKRQKGSIPGQGNLFEVNPSTGKGEA